VIAGDITVSIGDVELLSIRIRLLVASVDKAKEIGINWWESDPYLSTRAQELMMMNQKLLERVSTLEQELTLLKGDDRESAVLPKAKRKTDSGNN
jgi:hypothetical protein